MLFALSYQPALAVLTEPAWPALAACVTSTPIAIWSFSSVVSAVPAAAP